MLKKYTSIVDHTLTGEESATQIYETLGLEGPGNYAERDEGGCLLVWDTTDGACDDDDEDVDAIARAIYRSPLPISDADWDVVRRLAWIDGSESI